MIERFSLRNDEKTPVVLKASWPLKNVPNKVYLPIINFFCKVSNSPVPSYRQLLKTAPFFLQILFRDSSKRLYEALDQRVFFKTVSIVVPSSWRDGKCQTIIRPPKGGTPYRSTDVIVTNIDPVHGDNPFTQQTSGCGQPGDKISLPYSFVTAWNQSWAEFGDPSKLFVKEWAKLRYGIFDEHGYIHDPMYPNFYYANGQVMPTGSIDVPLGGIWINMMTGHTGCDPKTEPNCLFYPHDKLMHQVTCSLGNVHFLPNVTKFCDARNNLPTHGR